MKKSLIWGIILTVIGSLTTGVLYYAFFNCLFGDALSCIYLQRTMLGKIILVHPTGITVLFFIICPTILGIGIGIILTTLLSKFKIVEKKQSD